MKYLAILAFVAVLVSLAVALLFMLKNPADGKSRGHKMAFALAVRVAISILLFVSILLAWKLGYITPTGIRAGQ